jgi:hypothetical protein
MTMPFILNAIVSISTIFKSCLLAIMFQYTNLQGIQSSAYKILVILQVKKAACNIIIIFIEMLDGRCRIGEHTSVIFCVQLKY